MIRTISGLLCVLLLIAISKTNYAAPNLPSQESALWNRFLSNSNDVMISSRGLEIHYKQIPTSKIDTSALKLGNPNSETRKYLANFAHIVVKNPIKTNTTTLLPGNYNLGLQEERLGSGKWFFAITEVNGRSLSRIEPVFESLAPAMCAHVMTLELDRKPGSNLLKIKMKLSDLSITTKDALEL
ncbi:MAG: hypothetical protein FD167_3409 [bacterium]|nr:MAG: hypothetical protein FD167_3409 [bacterium]